MLQRLQKAIAAAGVASRRRAEELIAAGRVKVNGEVVREMGTLVDPATQTILVDGKPLTAPAEFRYIALHKPVGYVSTLSDPHAPKKVTDLVAIPGTRLVPAGRLDADSEGLILLSNDGAFVYKVTHPSQSLGKTYHATVSGFPSRDTIQKLARGLMLEGEERPTAPAGAKRLGPGPTPDTTLVELTLHEGRNRQVRRMMDRVGHPVLRLVRVRVGPVLLGNLKPGEWRDLTAEEIARIRRGGAAVNKTAESGGEPAPQRRPVMKRPLSGRVSGRGPIKEKQAGSGGRPVSRPLPGKTAKEDPASMTNQRTGSKRTQRNIARRPKGVTEDETGDRGRPRPGQGKNNRESAS